MAAVRGEKKRAKSISPARSVRTAAGLNAATGRASYRTLRSTVKPRILKLTDKVAGNVAARDMEERPLSRRQPVRDQADQIADIAACAFDGGKTLGTGARSGRVANREDRNAALAADPCEGAHAVGAGAQNSAKTGQLR